MAATDGGKRRVGGKPRRDISLLGRLKEAMWLGTNEDLPCMVGHLPEDLRSIWPKLAYVDFTVDKLATLEQILKFLDHPESKDTP